MTPTTHPASSGDRGDIGGCPSSPQPPEAATGVAVHHMLATLGTRTKNRLHSESQLRTSRQTASGKELCQRSTTSCPSQPVTGPLVTHRGALSLHLHSQARCAYTPTAQVVSSALHEGRDNRHESFRYAQCRGKLRH